MQEQFLQDGEILDIVHNKFNDEMKKIVKSEFSNKFTEDLEYHNLNALYFKFGISKSEEEIENLFFTYKNNLCDDTMIHTAFILSACPVAEYTEEWYQIATDIYKCYYDTQTIAKMLIIKNMQNYNSQSLKNICEFMHSTRTEKYYIFFVENFHYFTDFKYINLIIVHFGRAALFDLQISNVFKVFVINTRALNNITIINFSRNLYSNAQIYSYDFFIILLKVSYI